VIHNLTRKACPTNITQGRCDAGRVMYIIAIASVSHFVLPGGGAVIIKKCVVYPVLVLKITGTQMVQIPKR
jgi:hypothetical protein